MDVMVILEYNVISMKDIPFVEKFSGTCFIPVFCGQ